MLRRLHTSLLRKTHICLKPWFFFSSLGSEKTEKRHVITILLATALIISFGAIILDRLTGEFGSNITSNANKVGDSNSGWSLSIDGLVRNPINLSFSDLTALPKTTVNADLRCVDFPRVSVAQGNWTGVRLASLLESVGVSTDAIKVAFYAKDGYTTDLTLATAMREDIIVAYERDGTPLKEHLRLVVPGTWGYKWISILNRIELVDYDFKGFYESKGYSDEAKIPESQM